MTALLVFLGGAIGAPLRYLIDRFVQGRWGQAFPWGTLSVNIIGSFLLGVLYGVAPPPEMMAFAGIGICGALTTFSTFGFETMRLLEEGSVLAATMNALGNLVLGILAAAGGYALLLLVP